MKFDSLFVTHLPNIRYLTGFTGTSACVVTGGRRRLFFTDFRYQRQAEKQVKDYRVHVINGPLLKGVLGFMTARRMKLGVLGFESAHTSHKDYLLIKRELKGVKLVDAGGAIEKRRLIKTRAEIELISRASEIADRALRRLSRYSLPGRSEKEVAWMLETFMREAGSGPLPFEIIVASGPRAAMPHGIASDRIIKKKELVVIDMGASAGGYCCDITRTLATGPLSRRQSLIYETVRKAQKMALDAVKPGAEAAAVDKVARDFIADAGFAEAFGHALGHGVGLEAHEKPVLSPSSKDILMPGMVLTIEPGIYTGRTGVRIEDTVVVAKDGAVPLTRFMK